MQNGIELFSSDADRWFFSDFEMFADALNHRFEPNEPWRVQELPNAELTGREEPDYGRRYEIFYNKYSVGNLQIFAGHPYDSDNQQVGTEIELHYARLLPFAAIKRFVFAIANFTASGNAEEALRGSNTLHETMLNELSSLPCRGLLSQCSGKAQCLWLSRTPTGLIHDHRTCRSDAH